MGRRPDVSARRKEVPDGYFSRGKEIERAKRRISLEKSKTKSKKKNDDMPVADVAPRKKYRKSKEEKSKKEIPIKEPVMENSDLIDEIKRLDAEIKAITNEINDNYFDKVIETDYAEIVKKYIEESNPIFDQTQNWENYTEDLRKKLKIFLAEGKLLLEGLRSQMGKISEDEKIVETAEEKKNDFGSRSDVFPTQKNADFNLDRRGNKPPYYTNSEIPDEMMDYKNKGKFRKKPGSPFAKENADKTDQLEESAAPVSEMAETEEINKESEKKEMSKELKFIYKYCFKSADKMLETVRKGREKGFFLHIDSEEKEKQFIRNFVSEFMKRSGNDDEAEIIQVSNEIEAELFSK